MPFSGLHTYSLCGCRCVLSVSISKMLGIEIIKAIVLQVGIDAFAFDLDHIQVERLAVLQQALLSVCRMVLARKLLSISKRTVSITYCLPVLTV